MRDCVATLEDDSTRRLAAGQKVRKKKRTGTKPVRSSRCEFELEDLLFAGSSRDIGVFLLEALDAAGGIDELLLARKERVATGTDFHAEHIALDRRTGLKSVPASAMNGNRMIVGVNTGFHESLFLLWPVCTANFQREVTAASLGHKTNRHYTARPADFKIAGESGRKVAKQQG
jgi:hypothetical protein